MYRQQFLDYLDRYDNVEPRDVTLVSSAPQKQSLDNEWFRKPPTPSRSQSTSFSTHSQRSATQEADDDIGPTHQEGESYLSTPCVKQVEEFDILEWWSANEVSYPQLARVAKDILAIPISQVGVERVFNTARDVIGDQRHRLSTRAVRQIMILKDTISSEQCNEEDSLPQDEVDDLLELPACNELIDGVESDGNADSTDEEPLTPSGRQQRPRKRMKPWRYRDDVP
jgi:hypothetical protein